MVFVSFHQWICAIGLAFPVRGGVFHMQPCFYLPPSAHFLKLPGSQTILHRLQTSLREISVSFNYSESPHPLYLALRRVSVSQRQIIHITTSLTIDPGPITRSPRCCYVGLLTFFFFYWHFHLALLNNWVTGACHGAQKSKREHAETENSHKLSGHRGRPTSSLSFVPTQNAEMVSVFFPMN